MYIFFNDTATTEIYTLSLHDALPIFTCELGTTLVTGDYKFDQTPVDGIPTDVSRLAELGREGLLLLCGDSTNADRPGRPEEHTSELQARPYLDCRLHLEINNTPQS